jgi:hypothetical protein
LTVATATTTTTPTGIEQPVTTAPVTVSPTTVHRATVPPPTHEVTFRPTTTLPPITAPVLGGLAGGPNSGPLGPEECTATSGLGVTAGAEVASGGHQGFPIIFTNNGSSSCLIFGFPSAVTLTASGAAGQIVELSQNGTLGGLSPNVGVVPFVTLDAGQTASALIEGTTAASCASYPAISVTAPNDSVAVRVQLSKPLGGCSQIQIHPVVPGSNGTGS